MSTYDPDGKRTGGAATPAAAPSTTEAADWVAQGCAQIMRVWSRLPLKNRLPWQRLSGLLNL